MSLEVDRRDDLPMVHPEHDNYKYRTLQPDKQLVAHGSQAPGLRTQGRTWCGLRPTTLVLSIALAIAITLAVVAAGVGGSLAAKNKYVPDPKWCGPCQS